jgi:hypothetical protein
MRRTPSTCTKPGHLSVVSVVSIAIIALLAYATWLVIWRGSESASREMASLAQVEFQNDRTASAFVYALEGLPTSRYDFLRAGSRRAMQQTQTLFMQTAFPALGRSRGMRDR